MDISILGCAVLGILFVASLWTAIAQAKKASAANEEADALAVKVEATAAERDKLKRVLVTVERNLSQAKDREAALADEIGPLRAFKAGISEQRRNASRAAAAKRTTAKAAKLAKPATKASAPPSTRTTKKKSGRV